MSPWVWQVQSHFLGFEQPAKSSPPALDTSFFLHISDIPSRSTCQLCEPLTTVASCLNAETSHSRGAALMFWLQKIWHAHLWWWTQSPPKCSGHSLCKCRHSSYCSEPFPGAICHSLVWRALASRQCVGTIWLWFCHDRLCRKAYRLVALSRSACDHCSLNLSFPLLPFSGISSIGNLMTFCKLSSTYNYWTCLRFAKWFKYRLASSVSYCLWLLYGLATHPHLEYAFKVQEEPTWLKDQKGISAIKVAWCQ